LSVFVRHIVPFFFKDRDCSLNPKAEAPPGTRGRFWGTGTSIFSC
jgi:hypothetical protein